MRLVPSSLSGRLILAGTFFIAVALGATFLVMEHVLERFVTGQIDQRLDNKLVELASQIRMTGDGTIALNGDADGPPFDKAHHRSFWLIEGPSNTLQSRWLAPGAFRPPTREEIEDAPAPPPPPRPPGEPAEALPKPRTVRMPGPNGEMLHVRVVVKGVGPRSNVILAAAPLRAIKDPMHEAERTLLVAILILGSLLLAAGLVLTRIVLRPLTRLRAEVANVRIGRQNSLSAGHPAEVRPLVEELDALLAQNAANLSRARKHVANLAHGLKTPLATLSLGIGRLDPNAAVPLQSLVGSVERRVRHHLGRARAAALDGPVRTRTELGARVRDIVDALNKIYADKRVAVSVSCPTDLIVACEPQDVDEMLGNLLDNAFKFTRTRVACSAKEVGPQIMVEIADDGSGLEASEIEQVLRPGQRLDEEVPGFGFGLPIARELAELYGGDVTLVPGTTGLMVTIRLPKAV